MKKYTYTITLIKHEHYNEVRELGTITVKAATSDEARKIAYKKFPEADGIYWGKVMCR